MRTTWRRLALVCALLALAVQSLAAPRAKHVIIISFDGGNPTIIQSCKMPNVFSMAKKGAVTWQAQTVFPSITLVSHTSMLTGVKPDKHGIVWNDWIPTQGFTKAVTIFKLCHEKGLSTALFAGKEKFAHLFLPDSIDRFTIGKQGARKLAVDAAKYITDYRPALCFVHFTDTDSTGHAYGWGSPEQRKAFEDEDAGVATIRRAVERAGMARDTVIIMTADHGGHGKGHGSAAPEDMTIPWIAWGAGVRRSVQIDIPVLTCDTAATALWLLDVPAPANLDGKPVTAAFEQEETAR